MYQPTTTYTTAGGGSGARAISELCQNPCPANSRRERIAWTLKLLQHQRAEIVEPYVDTDPSNRWTPCRCLQILR
eukprot:13877006-Heterocapsa_arctica.AAC.1